MVRGLSAGGNRIRTIGPALVKGLSAVADERCRTDKLDGVIKHRSSRETTMVGRGAVLDGRLFLGWTDGSNPVPSSKESAKSGFLQQRVGHEPRGQNRTRSRPEPKVRIQLSPAASHTNPSIAAELLIERRSHQNWRRVMRRTGIVNLAARGMLAVSVARRIGSRGPLLAYCAAHSNGAGPQKGILGPSS